MNIHMNQNQTLILSEGIVITLKSGDKIKKKTDLYVKRAYKFPLCIKKGQNIDKILFSVIIQSEIDEFCKYCPHYSEKIRAMNVRFNELVQRIKDLQFEISTLEFFNSKDKALYIQENIPKDLQCFMYKNEISERKLKNLLGIYK